jgi:hypothetical protein
VPRRSSTPDTLPERTPGRKAGRRRADELWEAIEELGLAGRRIEDALLVRNTALAEYDRLYRRIARIFEGCCRLASLGELAERVRPHARDGRSPSPTRNLRRSGNPDRDLTLHRADRPDDARLVFDSVMDSAKTTQDEGTFWAPEDRAWLWYNDTIETHAFALRTLAELEPADGGDRWRRLTQAQAGSRSGARYESGRASRRGYGSHDRSLGRRWQHDPSPMRAGSCCSEGSRLRCGCPSCLAVDLSLRSPPKSHTLIIPFLSDLDWSLPRRLARLGKILVDIILLL